MRSNRRQIFFLLISLTAAAGLISSVVLIERHLACNREVTESARARLTSLTLRASLSIDKIVREAKESADSIAEGLTGGKLSHDTALKEMRASLEEHAHIFNTALSYRPYAYKQDKNLYSVLYVKKDGRINNIRIDRIYDYTRPQYKWFGKALTGKPYWSQPFYAEASEALLVTYSVPFYGRNRSTGEYSAKGVVTFSISMEEIKKIIESLDLGPTGFGALVSEKGVYLYHPDTELVIAGKTLRDAARELDDKDRLILAEKAEKHACGILDHRSATTGLEAWMIYTPIPSTGWSLQNTFVKNDLEWNLGLIRHRLIWIVISLVIFLSSSVLLLFRVHKGGRLRLWAASSLCALLLIAGIGSIWKISLSCDGNGENDGIRTSDRATLLRVMNSFSRASFERHTEAPVFIPTGLYLETAALNATGNLTISGYLWQKYEAGKQDSIARGFTMSNASELTAEENYRIVEKGYEIVRWHFSCVIPQNIDHSRYPLELAKLSIGIRHKELDHNVFLVPDLASFKFLNATALPGLRKGLFLPGWELSGSTFELRKIVCDTDFGLDRPLNKENFPSFHFNIYISRIFIDAFISNLTALIIVAVLLFTLLMITSKDERLVSFMQAGSGRILNICAAMFFVIALSHVDVRRRIASEQIFYLEYFYFIIYLAILVISINSVLYSMGTKIHLIQYGENLFFKLLFWPSLLGMLFIITVFVFY